MMSSVTCETSCRRVGEKGHEVMSDDPKEFYALIHPGGPGGVVRKKPAMQMQDAEAQPAEGYVVVFFPKIDCLGKATLDWPRATETMSQTPETAIAKFMDGIVKGQTWETYYSAGHRVRKVRIIDLGDAEHGNL